MSLETSLADVLKAQDRSPQESDDVFGIVYLDARSVFRCRERHGPPLQRGPLHLIRLRNVLKLKLESKPLLKHSCSAVRPSCAGGEKTQVLSQALKRKSEYDPVHPWFPTVSQRPVLTPMTPM